MDKNSVRLSINDEAIGIINSEGVTERLSVKADKIRNGLAYIVNDRMLLILIDLGDGVAEAHIAQSKINWPHIHTDINTAIEFILSSGFDQIYTNVPTRLKKTINLLAKHDFTIVDTINDEAILRWA